MTNLTFNPDNTLLLIDGSSFVFRAFHAMPEFTSPHGKPTGATYGVINMLKQLQKRYPTKHWACVFDTPGKTFRDEIHPEYKGTRKETPCTLIEQLEDIYTIVSALGIPVIMRSGIEADDIIGTIAIKAKNNGQKILIATGDKDFAQLVDDDITLINTMTNEVLDYAGVVNKFSVTPSQIIDYLSLVGDKVDNVPGVDKCGPKTAVKWLDEYGNLDTIIANSAKISGVVGENLRKAIPWLATAKTLVTIDTKLSLAAINLSHLDDLICKKPNPDTLRECYTRLGFKTWLNEINRDFKNVDSQLTVNNPQVIGNDNEAIVVSHSSNLNVPEQAEITQNCHPVAVSDPCFKHIEKDTVTISSKAQLAKIVDEIINADQTIALLAVGNTYPEAEYLKIVIINTNDSNYVILNNSTATTATDLFANDVAEPDYSIELTKLLQSKVKKVLPNYKETLQLFAKTGLHLTNVIGDVTLAHYIKNSKQKHSLLTIYKEYLDLDILDLPSTTSKLNKDSIWLNNNSENNSLIGKNCTTIINHTLQLEKAIRDSMDAEELKLYQETELPLAQILVDIETAGIMLDLGQFKQLDAELSARLHTLENEIYQQAGSVFNINSPKQLQEILFTNLKLPTLGIKKNTNAFSTDEDSLKLLEEQGITIATALLEYRGLGKLLNTYVNKLPILVDKNHRVHTTFEQALVASGRLSSSNPNLQNIPIKSEWGRRIRRAFIAAPGSKLICADYSQIELRILAHSSSDENLISAFNNNLDIHSATASEIFHKPLEEISKDERRYAKTINFSLLYGKTVFGLAQELNIDRFTAKTYIDAYFAKYPKIKQCMEDIKQFGRDNGYVKTVFGRRIYLPNINASNKMLREAEERLALNAPMQGTSADIIKIAMCNLVKWLNENKLKSKMILQVHDELILEVPENEVEIIQNNLANIMVNAVNLTVKMAVEVKIADNWDDAH